MRLGRRGALLAAWLLASCQSQEAQGRPPATRVQTDVTAEDYVAPALPRGWVLLRDAYGGVHRVEVEVAATGAARTRGLMWRKELPVGQGMLFIFPQEAVLSFWMRNTLIPLDMLFINGEKRVVGIIVQAEPRTDASRTVGEPSRYVLEVPGGWSQQVGLRPGLQVDFEGLEGLRVEP